MTTHAMRSGDGRREPPREGGQERSDEGGGRAPPFTPVRAHPKRTGA